VVDSFAWDTGPTTAGDEARVVRGRASLGRVGLLERRVADEPAVVPGRDLLGLAGEPIRRAILALVESAGRP
jgi:hypothetical protein